MAYVDIGSKIIQAYLGGVKARQEQEQLAQEFQLKTESAKQRKEEFTKELEQKKTQFDLEHAMRKIGADLKHQLTLQGIQKNQLETGVAPPNSTITETTPNTTQQDFEALNQGTQSIPRIITPSIPENFGEDATQAFLFGGNNQIRPEIVEPQINREVTLSTGDKYTIPDQRTYDLQQAARMRTLQEPKIEGAIKQAIGIAEGKFPMQLKLETVKDAAGLVKEKQKQDAAKELQKQKDVAASERGIDRNKALITAANARRAASGGLKNRYLTPEEADKYNVPGGSTIEDIKGKPVVKRLAAAEQKRFDTISDLYTLTEHIQILGDKTGYSAVGSLGRGSLRSGISSITGGGSEDEKEFRSQLGNFDGMISELRAGKVITANEEIRLRRYVPQLNVDPSVFVKQLTTFQNTLKEMAATILAPAARRESLTAPASGGKLTSPKNRVDEMVKRHLGGK